MVRFEQVTKVYGDNVIALDELSLDIRRGELMVLIGPSGCGKTTALETINGLVQPTAGKVYINGAEISALDRVQLRRNIGYVIQQIGLFPHMTIATNIALPLRMNKWPADKIEERVNELMSLVGMDAETFRTRYPGELSGGQQQRIGVLRALAAEPDIILMDEPFGALDPITREQLQDELKNLQDQVQKTVIFVTHDMDEAIRLGDRIVIMRAGQVVQAGTPEEILVEPANDFVQSFIGRDRLLPVINDENRLTGLLTRSGFIDIEARDLWSAVNSGQVS